MPVHMPWPRKGGVWWAGIARQQQPTPAPALLHHRMERIDGCSLDFCILGAEPARDHGPEDFRIREPRRVVAGHQHDLPASPSAVDVDQRHGPRRIAELQRIERQRLGARALRIGQHVDNQPRLMQAEIDLSAADGPAHQRARTVTADDKACVQIVDGSDFLAEMDAYIGEAREALAQDSFEDRLVEYQLPDQPLGSGRSLPRRIIRVRPDGSS